MNEAELYSKHNGLQKQDAFYVLSEYFRLIKWNLHGDDRILDVGCGSGDVTTEMLLPMLPNNCAEVIGVDVSKDMIEYANQKYKKKNLSFCQLDIATSEIPDNFVARFDHAVSFYCMHWIQDQKQAFTNIFNALKPGGDMLVTFLASNPIYQVYRNLAKKKKWQPYMEDVENFICIYQDSTDPALELEKMLSDIGFDVHLCHCKNRTYSFPSSKAVRKSVNAVNPFISRMPLDLREEHIDDYIVEAKNMNFMEANNNDEKIIVPYTILVAYVSKSNR